MSQTTKYMSTRFLIVDHSAVMRRMIKHSLKEAGYTVTDETDNCLNAIRKLQQKSHDFVIAELNAPHMDGLMLLHTIRSDPELANTPVIIISATSRKDDVLAAAKAGANGYVVKPFSISILARKIIRVLDKMTLAANQQT
ncbi:two-component system chemotaxis response regulator CheY [Jezberella montanilacus]|uniref:Two-component system chemotaxis response regulator CheY n=1 Tax=Jezberella montanilacus TaxID=323426 RepID=A0A2T0XC25_9BURK|nr:response regulator [Jezberella montanilacus]PRY96476.1 two-component system chemotaxis response regulator CheY [Jezberella montanilacus]